MICRAHNHMTLRQYGLWTRIRELQHKFGFVYFDGEDQAASFHDTSSSMLYRVFKSLQDSGWFQLKVERRRKKDGTWEASQIVAVSHAAWASQHPQQCRYSEGLNLSNQVCGEPVPPVGMDNESEAATDAEMTLPIWDEGATFPDASILTGETDHCHPCNSPSPPVGRRFGSKQCGSKQTSKSKTRLCCAQDFDSSFSEEKESSRESDEFFPLSAAVTQEVSSADVDTSVPVPRKYLKLFRTWLDDNGISGQRESARDHGNLRRLWNIASGSDEERYSKVQEALDDAMCRGCDTAKDLFCCAENVMRGLYQ